MTQNRATGFTLIEILVAIVIISVVLGVALLKLNFNNPESNIKQEAARLIHTMELADQQAIFQSQEIGFYLQDNQYEYLEYKDGKWLPLEDSLLKKRTIPEDIEITLNIDGIESTNLATSSDKKNPQIVFYSSGEWTPFEMILQPSDFEVENNFAYTLNNITTGKLELEREANE